MNRCKRKVLLCWKDIIGTWTLRNTNQGKLKITEQEVEHLNIVILQGVSKIKWTRIGNLQSENCFIWVMASTKETVRN